MSSNGTPVNSLLSNFLIPLWFPCPIDQSCGASALPRVVASFHVLPSMRLIFIFISSLLLALAAGSFACLTTPYFETHLLVSSCSTIIPVPFWNASSIRVDCTSRRAASPFPDFPSPLLTHLLQCSNDANLTCASFNVSGQSVSCVSNVAEACRGAMGRFFRLICSGRKSIRYFLFILTLFFSVTERHNANALTTGRVSLASVRMAEFI